MTMISIVIPVAGAPEQALRCFEGIAAQPESLDYEVIVVDDASVGLEALLERLAGDVFGALALSLAARGARVEAIGASAITAPSTRTGAGRRGPGEAPELTIVIPTLDAASERVRACIAAVQARTEVAHEIVIVDNG